MAEALTPPGETPAPPPGELVPRPPRVESGSYRGRFGLVYGALALLLAGAIAGFVVLVVQPGKGPEAAWSAWRPEGDDAQKQQEIADHVGAAYRLPSGQQLVSVQAAPPRVQDIPIGAIAIRRPSSGSSADQPISVLPVEGAAVYILCGLGTDCAIEEGTPSAERMRLLRRESLELALYTFRYVSGKGSVVTFLPPKPGDKPSFALFFQRGDLSAELDRPLRSTLPDDRLLRADQLSALEVPTIDRLTEPHLFRFSFQQLQDGTAVLVLDDLRLPPPDQGQTTTGQQDTTTTQQ
jgi:hypothetical protein